ncbi:MAG: MliC family protein [Alphaproteobacteria bacterium]
MKKAFLILSMTILCACSTIDNFKGKNKFEYQCGTQEAQFVTSRGEEALLIFNENKYLLKQTISASGAKYINEDENVIFWSKGNEASLEINNVILPKCIEETIS